MDKNIIRKAKLEDIDSIFRIAKEGFHKLKMGENGLSFNDETILNNMRIHINSPICPFFVSEENDKINGYIWAILIPDFYDQKETAFKMISIQADNILSKVKQGKIFINLINEFEKLVKADIGFISVSQHFQFTSWLQKKDYKLVDSVYFKRFKNNERG